VLTRKKVFYATTFILLVVLFFAPQLIFIATAPISIQPNVNHIRYSDAAIVFGAAVEDGQPTPILRERLDTAIQLFEAQQTSKIVVSNTDEAAQIMKKYLIEKGIPEDIIEMDNSALTTPDTCINEKSFHPEGRAVVFLSQGYHLPRLIEQCRREGVTGRALAVNKITPVEDSISFFYRCCIRGSRFLRESSLSWLVTVNLYD